MWWRPALEFRGIWHIFYSGCCTRDSELLRNSGSRLKRQILRWRLRHSLVMPLIRRQVAFVDGRCWLVLATISCKKAHLPEYHILSSTHSLSGCWDIPSRASDHTGERLYYLNTSICPWPQDCRARSLKVSTPTMQMQLY